MFQPAYDCYGVQIRRAGVTPVPVSCFYAERDVCSHVRFCFAKQPAELEKALEQLGAWLHRSAVA